MAKTTSRFSTFAVLLFVAVAGAGAFFLLRDLDGPEMTVPVNSSGRLGPTQEIRATMRDPAGIRSVQVTVKRGGQSMTVLRQEFDVHLAEQSIAFDLRETKLPEGQFELEIKANDASYAGFGRGNSTTVDLPMRMDTQPPKIAVKTVPPYIRRGGCALIVFTVSEDVGKAGVSMGEYFFPAHRQPSGAYACLFPFPYFMTTADYSPEIMAEDLAGNNTSSRLLVNMQNRNFQSDTLVISENFLNSKADELAALCPGEQTTLAQYICVNQKVRIDNDKVLLELGQNTNSEFLWSGNFQRLPRSSVKANFADARTYTYNGDKIDEQTHTGLDLASVSQAEVPAANIGKVIFTGELGIYGNLIVIDHGLGLMSIYSHLTEIRVNTGDNVASGQIIGTTGITGLAGGDHVHFAFLVGGIPVQPLEWLDPNWIKNNITDRLNVNL